jgi:hypothetical protein
MKKIIITVAIAISTFAAFATEEPVSSAVLNAFNKEFAGVKDVQWTSTDKYVKASFVFNGQSVNAFYDQEAQLIAMARNISSLELPISLQTSLKNQYKGYWISDLFEMSNHDGTSYYITIENADSKVVLTSSGNSKWTSFKKAAKI